MHLLVTRGAGFIGSHLVDSLLEDGHTVTAVDSFDDFYARVWKERNIALHRSHPAWRLIEADIRDGGALRREWPGQCDAIVHLAARAGVRPSIMSPLLYQDVNVRGTHELLELAREKGVGQFVFASSSSVYGVDPRLPCREDDHVLRPISPYASTKVSGELLGHVYSHLYGIRFIALRLFTVYGPRQRPDLAIHKFARLIVSGQPIPVFGNGESQRDYTFIADIVSGIRAAIAYQGSPFEVLNLGNGRPVTLRGMIEELEAALGERAILEWLDEQPGDVRRTWADVSKARQLLGYEPRTGFREGVRRFSRWFVRETIGAPPPRAKD
jgi:UDP-glucuronate 4-epimerase